MFLFAVTFGVKRSLYSLLPWVFIEHLLCAREKFLCFQSDSRFRRVTSDLKKKRIIFDPGGKCPERSRIQLSVISRLQAREEHEPLNAKAWYSRVLLAPQCAKSLTLREHSINAY